jgi:type IV fimbrial biogenesis protein FimT
MIASTPNSLRARQSGTTLLEVVMALLIAAVLTTSALPSFANLMRSRDLALTAGELLSAELNLARSEALSRGQRVELAARDGNWNQGWDLFVDANDNGHYDQGETLIRSAAHPGNGLTIAPQFGITYNGRVISYDAPGRPVRPGSQGLVVGRLVLTQGSEVRSLCFASLRVRLVKTATCS